MTPILLLFTIVAVAGCAFWFLFNRTPYEPSATQMTASKPACPKCGFMTSFVSNPDERVIFMRCHQCKSEGPKVSCYLPSPAVAGLNEYVQMACDAWNKATK